MAEYKNDEKELKLILGLLKKDYGKDPFVDTNGKKTVDPKFMFFVVDKYLHEQKRIRTLIVGSARPETTTIGAPDVAGVL